MPCPGHRDGAPLPAGLCAGGGCAGTPQRMSLRWLLGHRSVMLSALWMLRQLKLEIPEATQRPAQVPAGASCRAAASPHCCAGGHAGRAAGAPCLVPAIGNPGLRVRGQPGANHRVTPGLWLQLSHHITPQLCRVPLGAACWWVPSLSPRTQDTPPSWGHLCHQHPVLHGTAGCSPSAPGRGSVVLCFCSCCKLTAEVSLYTEYLQILIYICISFCYSIFLCSGSTNAVFFLFTDATGQEHDGGFVWPARCVCVSLLQPPVCAGLGRAPSAGRGCVVLGDVQYCLCCPPREHDIDSFRGPALSLWGHAEGAQGGDGVGNGGTQCCWEEVVPHRCGPRVPSTPPPSPHLSQQSGSDIKETFNKLQ